MDDRYLLVQFIKLNRALVHIGQAFLQFYLNNLGLGLPGHKEPHSPIATAEVHNQAFFGWNVGKVREEDAVHGKTENVLVLNDFDIGGEELVNPLPCF